MPKIKYATGTIILANVQFWVQYRKDDAVVTGLTNPKILLESNSIEAVNFITGRCSYQLEITGMFREMKFMATINRFDFTHVK